MAALDMRQHVARGLHALSLIGIQFKWTLDSEGAKTSRAKTEKGIMNATNKKHSVNDLVG